MIFSWENLRSHLKSLPALVVGLSLISTSCKNSLESTHSQAANKQEFFAQHTEINSSIAVLGTWDYLPIKGASECERMVARAIQSPHWNSTINFIPTHGFIVGERPPEKEDVVAEISESDKDRYALTFGDRICYRTSATECQKPTTSMILQFENSMARCFSKALAAGKGITLTPHLDDGHRLGRWRNLHVLDPVADNDWTCSINKDSYYCAFLKPLARALTKARGTSPLPVSFAAQGEMGATVFAYPEKYQRALDALKKILDPTDTDPHVKVGISINFNKIAGFYPIKPTGVKALQKLLKSIGFLGVSAYPNLKPSLDGSIDPAQFDQILDSLSAEFKQKGIDLRRDASHLEFDFSEVGIGGSTDYVSIAQTYDGALTNTWAGLHGPFNPRRNPWSSSITRKAGEAFYCALGQYLSGQNTYRWKVRGAFLWNLASWDIQAIYHSSYAAEDDDPGSYFVPSIVRQISRYNKSGNSTCSKAQAGDQEALQTQASTSADGEFF